MRLLRRRAGYSFGVGGNEGTVGVGRGSGVGVGRGSGVGVGSGSGVGVGGRGIPVGVGRGFALEDGPGRLGAVGLAQAEGVGATVLPLAALGTVLAAGDGEPASLRASAMIRAASGPSWPLAWPL
jgi:hypothetical protein